MEKLKEEILEVVNEAMALEEPAIVAVYFNEFIVQ
jgi:flagellar basal body-associated protein FliL